MRLLVTGAAGFVGGTFAAEAGRCGFEVLATDRRPMPRLGGSVRTLTKELTAVGPDDLAPGIDAVVHFATGKSHYVRADVAGSARYRAVIDETVSAARHAFALAAGAGAQRVVHISSMTVYPAPIPISCADGVAALDPHPERRGVYADSKIRAEQAVHELAAATPGVEACVLRLALVCGPGMGHGDARSARNTVLRSTLVSSGKVVPPGVAVGIGRPAQAAPLLDIRDLMSGLVALLEQQPRPGAVRVWDVHTPDPPSKRALIGAYAMASRTRVAQVWLPQWAAMGGAWLVEGALRARGRRAHVPYRVARSYRIDPERLPVERFWRDVGITPRGSVASCMALAVDDGMPELQPARAV
ncbi:MAG: NAD(P)-dependent oxidoreductase [Candidatus Dormibacteraeota bacterium]|nr:NAD(P)-dependent oxidoreductase [Candidatus Dormibacteraeota bacterium]MBV9524412.1 NAD(P)-dependent oxidoreductase [Candidatus Dormibacteraeota bacterium]